MTKKSHLALLCAVVIIGLLIPPVMAVEPALGEHIHPLLNYAQERPDIDGNMIVWEDDRNGNKDIYFGKVDEFRELSAYTGKQITTNPASQEKPSISGDYIVWQDYRNGNWDIYLYKRSTGKETQLTADPGKQWMPIVRGNYAAWYAINDSSSRTNVVLYDIAAGKVKKVIDCNALTTIPGGQTEFKPALSEKYVAWVEGDDWKVQVHYYDIAAEKIVGPVSTSTAATQAWPSLHGSLIVWEDYRHGNADIYMTDLANPSEEEQRITSNTLDQVSPAISGSIIAWEDLRKGPDGKGERGIFLYDLNSREEKSVRLPDEIYGVHLYPAVSGNTIVWQSGRSSGSNLYIFVYDPSSPATPTLTSIKVTPPTAMLEVGGTEKFDATAYDQFDKLMTGITVTWESSDTTVGTIDADGHFTALAAGKTTITAAANGVTGTATVTVRADEPVDPIEPVDPVDPVLTSIQITPPTATFEVGGTKKFDATAYDQFDKLMTGITVTWESSDTTVGTIDADGHFTALAAGKTTITAAANGVTGTATVTVRADEPVDPIEPVDPVDPVLTSIQITPPRATLEVHDDQKFIVIAYDQNNNVMPAGEVTWESSDTTVGTIDADGIFTALAEGTTTITAKTGSISDEAVITVNAAAPALGMVVISPSAVILEAGDTRQFDLIAFDPFGTSVPDASVTWKVSDPCIGTIDECGVFTALCAGSVTICAIGDGATGTATVTVTCADSALSRIVVTPPAITLNAGDEETFFATAYDQYGDEIPDIEVTWESSDTTVGTIDADGHFTALAEGTATITASTGCRGATGTATVTVTSAPLDLFDTVVISPSAITLDIGDSREFIATAYDAEGDMISETLVTWSCDDETIGTINADGLFVAKAAGTTTITASVEGISEIGTAEVTVRSDEPTLARIAVSPSDFYIAAGQKLKLTATAYNQYGDEIPDIEVTWESSDPCVGTIDDCGVFTALNDGEVILTASADCVSGSACVTVEPSIAVPTSIEIEPSTATVAVGETQEFIATVFDQCDDEMAWVRVAWSCSDPDVGTIDVVGLFAAFAEGTADVTARAGCIEETAEVTVTARPTTEPGPDPTTEPGSSGGSTYHSGSDGGGDTGPTFSAGVCENLKSGDKYTFSNIDRSSVSSVTITARDSVPSLMVTVKEVARPAAARPPADEIYEYVDISLYWADQRKISNAEIVFTIPAAWLEDHSVIPEDVRLMRYVNSVWQSLETEVIDDGGGMYRFRAITPGFSTFAIAVAGPDEYEAAAGETANTTAEEETNVTAAVTTEEATTVATTVPATTTPAAPLIYAPILAPLAFLLFWQRRKN